jgi:photosystem II stability/assembly factor-like uncharacterized protein
MKKTVKNILIIFILTTPTFCFSQWTDVTFDTANFYKVVKFKNQNEGLIMGDTSIIYKTIDGGNTWNNIICPININLNDFQYINDTLIYAYGYRIIKSENSGNTWDVFSYIPTATAKVYFINRTIGYAVGGDGIYKSNDAGLNWLSVWNYSIGQYGFGSIQDIKFINDSIGFACGTKHISGGGIFGIILKTIDSGNSWNIVYDNSPWGSEVNKIEIVDNSNIYCFTSTSLLKSTDLGNTWTNLNINIEGTINSFFFKNNDTAYAVSNTTLVTPEDYTGKRKIFLTVNGWQTWITQYLEVTYLYENGNNRLNSVYFNNDSTGFAVGYKKVLRTNNCGGNIDIIDSIPTNIYTIHDEKNIFFNIYPNPTVDYINIGTNINSDIEIEMMNIYGLTMYNFYFKKGHQTIDMTNLPNGIYFIKIKSGNIQTARKILKM